MIPFYFGRIAINEKTHTANFTCDDGYQLKGLSQSVCENGKWSHPPPICIRKREKSIKKTEYLP